MSQPGESIAATPQASTEPLILDCRGLRCPLPVIELAKTAAGQLPGTEIRLVSDDPAARTDIPAWCRLRGHVYLAETTHLGCAAYQLRLS